MSAYRDTCTGTYMGFPVRKPHGHLYGFPYRIQHRILYGFLHGLLGVHACKKPCNIPYRTPCGNPCETPRSMPYRTPCGNLCKNHVRCHIGVHVGTRVSTGNHVRTKAACHTGHHAGIHVKIRDVLDSEFTGYPVLVCDRIPDIRYLLSGRITGY